MKLFHLSGLLVSIILTSKIFAQGLIFSPEDAHKDDQLGWDVAITDDFAVSSSSQRAVLYDGEVRPEAGCVYLHRNENGKWEFFRKLTSPVPQSYEDFGGSVDISDEYIVIGAEGHDATVQKDPMHREGVAYVYQRANDGYELKHELALETPAKNSRFGRKVAVSENYLAVACHFHGDTTLAQASRGAVLVYRLSRDKMPEKIATLVSEDGSGEFGYALALSGNLLAIAEQGSRVNLFELNEKEVKPYQELKLETGSDMGFGNDVALAGDVIVVGATGESAYEFYNVQFPTGTDSVMVKWILDEESFSLHQEFVLNDSIILDSMGVSKAEFKAEALPYETWVQRAARKAGAGKVYVYQRAGDGFKLSQILEASERYADDAFGHRVAIAKDLVVVSAFGRAASPGGEEGERHAGAVYAFQRHGSLWEEVQLFQEEQPKGWAKFGFSIDCSGTAILIGCRLKDVLGKNGIIENAGSVYFYEVP